MIEDIDALRASMGRFGGSIPSPRQMTREQAQLRALLEQMGGFSGEPPMQTRTPQGPTFKDIPKMTPEQLEQYNKPMGSGETNPFDMFMQYLRGGQ